jgi:hypothetical protein
MNENKKTLIFLGVALLAVLLAVFGRTSLPISNSEDVAGQLLYPDLKDPLSVTSLEIIEFDDQRGEIHPLQVAQVDVKGKTRWSIPSHDNYPADAKDQVASAAAGLMGLKVIEQASSDQGDQREYGVVDPDPKGLKVGDTGVGTKVVMCDKGGKALLSLIIGKEVPGRQGLRYVRKAGEAPIYIVEAKTDKLSTKFENWIERNLLGINSFDIKRLWIRDHSVDQMNNALIQRGEMVVEYNDAGEPKWKMIEDRRFVTNKAKPTEGEWMSIPMANDQELNAARLDELKTALDDLKIVDIRKKPAGLSADLKAARDFTSHQRSLAAMGFFAAEVNNKEVEVFSNDGEIRIVMKDGVEYVLRFGEIAGTGKKDKDADPLKDKKGPGLNRYLFVMADFRPNILPKPQLTPLPEVKKDGDKKAQEEERSRIEKDNKRKQEEYDQKVAEAKKRVKELNTRFADWYYIISDEVYHKIHLGHDEITKKKEKAKDRAPGKEGDHAGHDHGEAVPPLVQEPAKEPAKTPAAPAVKEPVKEPAPPAKEPAKEPKKDDKAAKEQSDAKVAPMPPTTKAAEPAAKK